MKLIRRTLCAVLLVLVTAVATAQVSPSAYEYWFDGDYSHRTVGNSTAQELDLSIGLDGLSPGLHFLNFRAQDSNGEWGGFYRYAFMVPIISDPATARYEGWIDDDYAHRVTGNCTDSIAEHSIDISNLTYGIHFYNFRAQNLDGHWGNLQRYIFFVAEPDASAQVAAIRYWIDNDTLNIREQATRGMAVSLNVDISNLTPGTHTISCYLQNVLGDTTAVYHYDFEVGYVERPVITHRGNTITISTTTPSANIFYTHGNAKPTEESTRYTEPFEVTHNDTIRAFATRSGWFNSEEVRLIVDWFAEPHDYQSVDSTLASIEGYIDTARVTINTVDTQVREGTAWQQSHRQTCDTLRAMLACCTLDTLTKTQTYLGQVDDLEVLMTDIHDTGVLIAAEQQRLQAALDSLINEQQLLKNALDSVATKDEVSEIGRRTNLLQQDINQVTAAINDLVVSANDWTIQMQQAVTIASAIEQGIVVSTTAITTPDYTLRAEQLQRLHRYPQLRHIDLSRVKMENDALPDRAFSGLPLLVTASLPASVISFGSSLFADCPRLAAVFWNGSSIVTDRALADINNPNLLLYVNQASQVRDLSMENVVVNGVAERIVLSDGDANTENTDFCVPRAFHVSGDISYTHTYSQKTGKGECRGWETITLPFDVQTITHEVQGPCVPFAAYEYPKRPFWLCRLTEQGFEDATNIRAHIPYIISMPYNEAYSTFYQLNGNVTFAATNVDVPVTTQITDHKDGASFIPVYERIDAAQQVYALNVGEAWNGHAEGSVFVSDLRDVRPFQAYRTTTVTNVPFMSIADDLEDGTQGITDLLQTPVDTQHYYNLQGIPVQHPGKGVYIKGGKKTINR
ncbi:MAG: chitobiase/beta-hexosaminidase C-terminal domain-containing protein [Prevotella sp.]|nr:chitobiase/beta-hexosaminidase C-terminal domain-containing protein [Prevotella sp.]